MENRLHLEKSPYLLQHAENPVHWQPWDDAALAEARTSGKPILVSVGYATCHWCHVMEHESFSDPEVAEVMNRHFVCIKVDREERPDLDLQLMDAVVALNGNGGWPLNVFLTPDLDVFFGGTYFPKASRPGLPGWKELVSWIGDGWGNGALKEKAASAADAIKAAIVPEPEAPEEARQIDWLAKKAEARILSTVDEISGGFGNAPKFPMPPTLRFLLESRNATAREAALFTLERMTEGGLRDHLSGGFHRYSVDANWELPHFEKMLYDNAQLLHNLADAARLSRARFEALVRETADFLIREMQTPEGGFVSAFDADSLASDGIQKEGAYYVWSEKEAREACGTLSDFALEYWSFDRDGNLGADPHGMFPGLNLPRKASSIDAVATEHGITPMEARELGPCRPLSASRAKGDAPPPPCGRQDPRRLERACGIGAGGGLRTDAGSRAISGRQSGR